MFKNLVNVITYDFELDLIVLIEFGFIVDTLYLVQHKLLAEKMILFEVFVDQDVHYLNKFLLVLVPSLQFALDLQQNLIIDVAHPFD